MGGPPTGAGALVGQRLGKYEILALLALGGTAEIYLARIDGTNGFEKYVVVKCLHDHLAEDAEFVSMFLDEARLGAQLDHSNIVQTLALGEHEGRYYLVMEFIAGLSLALVGRRASERVRGGRVPVPIILNVAAQACAGLHYAHDRADGSTPLNLVHRDISPQNLVITYEGIVKVVDFGIAKADRRETHTRSGTVKGKFAYMSPEQCQAGKVDRRTDVFALGVIAWELLTGRRLFKRDSTYETYQAVVACQVPAPSTVNHELDPAVDELVMRALAREKTKRYPTAEAFGEAMIGYLHRRAKPSGPGEIARFFEECFAQELDEHVARMRELIEGRQKSVAEQKLLQWDASELDGSASVLEAEEEISAILEESESQPRAQLLAQASGAVGPVSPPLASRAPERPRHPALEPAAPMDGAVNETVPVRKQPAIGPRASASPTAASPAPAPHDEDFDSKTDNEAWRTADADEIPGDATRIEANPMAMLPPKPATVPQVAPGRPAAPAGKPATMPPVARRPATIPPPATLAPPRPATPAPAPRPTTTSPPPLFGTRDAKPSVPPLFSARERERDPKPTAPPRRGSAGVVTPPGLRAGGAPLDPLPHERDAMVVTPPATAVRPAFVQAATVIAPEARPQPSPGPGRFADVPTVLDVREAAPAPALVRPAARFADVKTVLADPGAAPAPARVATPEPFANHPSTNQTQMLEPGDMLEEGLTDPYMPPAPQQGWVPPQQSYQPDPQQQYLLQQQQQMHAPLPLPPPAQLIAMPPPGQAYPNQPYYAHLAAGGAPRKLPPWVLGVVFVLVLALATGITVAIARAMH